MNNNSNKCSKIFHVHVENVQGLILLNNNAKKFLLKISE